jgi:hypothetical protein
VGNFGDGIVSVVGKIWHRHLSGQVPRFGGWVEFGDLIRLPS